MNEDTQLVKEEDEDQKDLPQLPPKVELFIKYYSDPKEKDTFGNRTESAIKAYNLNRETQYNYARSLGSKLETKYNNIAREVLQGFGWGLPQMVGFAVQQMTDTKKETWWDRVMEVADYKKKDSVVINETHNTQVNQYNYNPNGEEVTDWNGKMLKMLEENA